MCGCMLMHAGMDHDEHQHASQFPPTPRADEAPSSEAQKCAHCGFPIKSGFTFCPNCGLKLQETICTACGQNVEAGWNTCAHCGSPLGVAAGQLLPA